MDCLRRYCANCLCGNQLFGTKTAQTVGPGVPFHWSVKAGSRGLIWLCCLRELDLIGAALEDMLQRIVEYYTDISQINR